MIKIGYLYYIGGHHHGQLIKHYVLYRDYRKYNRSIYIFDWLECCQIKKGLSDPKSRIRFQI